MPRKELRFGVTLEKKRGRGRGRKGGYEEVSSARHEIQVFVLQVSLENVAKVIIIRSMTVSHRAK